MDHFATVLTNNCEILSKMSFLVNVHCLAVGTFGPLVLHGRVFDGMSALLVEFEFFRAVLAYDGCERAIAYDLVLVYRPAEGALCPAMVWRRFLILPSMDTR